MSLLEIYDPKAAPRPIGIDLGTTHSLVAYVSDGKPVTLVDCKGDALLPSVVAYLSDGRVAVGADAIALASERPQETIVSVKRFMGKGADDPETRKLGPYEFMPLVPGEANVVRFRVAGRSVTPVEVSAEILRSLKARAEEDLRKVGGAVITVPAYFDDAQRQATKDAAKLAGIEVLRLLNEPTAAALAYGLEKQKRGTFVVYDLGGGTFDVTILSLDDGVFHVRSTGGDSALGGDDMDRALAHDILSRLGFSDPAQRTPTLVRLALSKAREIKHRLTDDPVVTAEIEGRGSAFEVRREDFEKLIAPLLERTAVACRRAMRDAEITQDDIDGVILVGGATRVPYVRTFVRAVFNREPLADVDPDSVVAMGAAIQADMLAGDSSRDDVLLLDVIPLSLGIEVGGGVVDKLLPRNSTIPTAARATYTTQEDGQTGFEMHVVQGEREMVSDCRSLARFTLRGIPPMPAGLAKLEVTFSVDEDGLLSVHAREALTGIEQHVSVKPSYGLDDETIENMLLDALEHGEEDFHKRHVAALRVDAARIAATTRKAVAADAALLSDAERQAIGNALTALAEAEKGDDPTAMRNCIETLDRATQSFAAKRMNRAIAEAIAGRKVDEVEVEVAHAKGVERAHEEMRVAP